MSQPFGGPWMDAAGNALANGYLKIKMTEDAAATGNLQICAGVEITVNLDSGGNFPNTVTLKPTSQMTAGTFYIVSAYTPKGQLVWGPSQQTL